MMKNLKPMMFENSRVPVWLSYLAPIEIWAISFGWFVWCRGVMSEATRRHETIHFQQQLEMFVIGFYIIYLWDYFKARLMGLKGEEAYYLIRAEREAYLNEEFPEYLLERKRWEWLRR